jgi:predicted TIM-barrel fold metal-dependent hydrolase
VLVQPSFLGTDNSYLLTALATHPKRLRGIAVVAPDISPMALDELDRAGIVGLRLNLLGEADPPFATSLWRRHLALAAGRGWQVEVQAEAHRLPRILPPLVEAGVATVVDHFGKPDPALGVEDPGFRYLLSQGATRRVWVKLSGAYRLGGMERGTAIAAAAVPLLRQAFGLDRLVWGSDWPHTQFEAVAGYGQTRALLDEWLPDAAERRAVLCDTPARLFGLRTLASA